MKDVAIIHMPYIGSVLSVNNCWIRGRGGHRTNAYKPEVKIWMGALEEKASEFRGKLSPPIYIRTSACFKDSRHPDMDNLEKVTLDGLKKGLDVDDKFFVRYPGEISMDFRFSPQIVLEIWDSECVAPPV